MEHFGQTMLGYLNGKAGAEAPSVEARCVEFKINGGKILQGVLVEKSLAIPLSVHRSADSSFNRMAISNLLELKLPQGESPITKTCSLLGFTFSVDNEGVFVGLQNFGQINALHLHPEIQATSQEEFLGLVQKIIERGGASLTVGECL